MKNWNHPAKHVKIIEGHEDSSHSIQAYTDGSKSDIGVGSGIAVFSDNNPTATLKYRLHGRCSNTQTEQMTILKSLEYIQYSKTGEKTVLVYIQPDNATIATKPEETYTSNRTNQD